MRWQVQEAKQRFSELLRRARDEGPQAVTKHGEEVAFVVDAVYYRQLTGQTFEFRDHLLHGPVIDGLDEALEQARSEMFVRPDPFTTAMSEDPAR